MVFKNDISEIENICKPAVSFVQAILEAIKKGALVVPSGVGILVRAVALWGCES